MAYPKNVGLNEVMLSVTCPSVVSGQNGAIRAPFRSQLMKVGSILGSAQSTADATVAWSYVAAGSTTSVSVLGSSVVTLTQSNSYAGQVTTSVPTTTIILDEDAGVTFAVTGSSTGGGNVTHFAVFKEA